MRPREAFAALPAAALVLLGGLGGCRGRVSNARIPFESLGNPERGRSLVEAKHCGACHSIPGVPGARGVVGPPLDTFARRSFIAGQSPNTPANLVRWVRDPHGLERGTAMPAVGLDESQARDVAAFLYTLQ